ncbi:MAG: GAF domain-containing protein, partial [Acidobacteria bacterium]|nr:GAF domain-containing protein [Acidobacteriota bacterium]
MFHEMGRTLTSTLDLNQVLQTIMEKISSFFRPDTWSLLLLDENTGELYFEIAIGEASDTLKQVRLKPGEGIAGWVALHGEPLMISNAYKDKRFAPRLDELTKIQTRSVV